MTDPAIRAAVVDALGKVLKLPPEWTVRLPDPAFDPVLADLTIDSLDGLELCMEIENRTGVEIDPADLLTVVGINDLVDLVAGRECTDEAVVPRAPRDRPLPPSFVQESIWNYCQALKSPAPYVLRMINDIHGPLDVENLRACLSEIVRRHEILRTTFPVVDGRPVQQIGDDWRVTLPVIDVQSEADPELAAEKMIIAQELTSDLAIGPVARFVLFKLGAERHLLLRLFHHMAWDAWSSRLFLEELSSFYEANMLGRPSVPDAAGSRQYADFAAWQRQIYDPNGPAYKKAVAWWADQFRDVPAPSRLPFKRPVDLVGVETSPGYVTRKLEPLLMQRIEQFRKTANSSLYKISLAAIAAVLAAETGNADVIIGGYVTGRRHRQLQDMIGDFTNTIALRFTLDKEASFADFLSFVSDTVQTAELQSEIPFERLSKELPGSGVKVPELDIIFTAPLDQRIDDIVFSDLKVIRYKWRTSPAATQNFIIELRMLSGEYHLVTRFDATRYDPALVTRFLDVLHDFIDRCSTHPEASVEKLIRDARGWRGLLPGFTRKFVP